MWKSEPVKTSPFLAGRGVCFQGLPNFTPVLKRSIAILMLGIYMLFAAGLAVQGHYCMNRLADVDLLFAAAQHHHDNRAAATSCDGCGMESNPLGCCHDETVVLKIEDDHGFQFTSLKINQLEDLLALAPPVQVLTVPVPALRASSLFPPRRPPSQQRCSPAMLCVFRC